MNTDYFLSHGSHQTADEGRCAMEWVSYLAGEEHSDSPVCVSPLLTRFCISLNDGFPDEMRQKLRPYLARTIGTRDDGLDEHRSWLALDWLIRTYTPAWLDLAGLREDAERLRGLSPVLAGEALATAMVDLGRARERADAARDAAGAAARDAARAAAWDAARDAAWDAAWAAARDAAWDAAWAAARDAAWAAAWDAARAAAWDAAWAAAWDAAWAAARDAAGAAARDAARAAAWDAAWDAARDAAWAAARDAARDAARAAARAALASTVTALQLSALDLLDRMLPKELIQLPVVEDAERVCGLRLEVGSAA